MNAYESLMEKATDTHFIVRANERHEAKDRVAEEIEEAEYGFEDLTSEKAEEIRNVLYGTVKAV